jgi:asparagine synthase (glutamine-hydrolysing)
MDGRMPADVVWRRNKYSFNAPDEIWLRKHFGQMKMVVSRSDLVAAVTRRSALIEDFERLPLRSQWRLYSLALWQESFGITV